MGKRSYIDPARLKLLHSTDAVYLITCHQTEYYCKDHQGVRCRKGFFSLFLQAVYGIQFANKMNLAYYVDFGNLIYSYSESEKFNGDGNFWNYYFEQLPQKQTGNSVYNSKFENFPLKVWERSFIRQLHQTVISNLKIKEEMKAEVDAIKERFQKNRVLGIHIRKTDHYTEVQPIKDETFLTLVDRRIASFDKLFLATDDEDVVSLFRKKYGDKLLINPSIRSTGDVSIHGRDQSPNGYELGKQALLDCYSLSFCDQAILSPSNLSYCALVLNPQLPYLLAESGTAKWDRLKTLIVYYLDRLGIRRW